MRGSIVAVCLVMLAIAIVEQMEKHQRTLPHPYSLYRTIAAQLFLLVVDDEADATFVGGGGRHPFT